MEREEQPFADRQVRLSSKLTCQRPGQCTRCTFETLERTTSTPRIPRFISVFRVFPEAFTTWIGRIFVVRRWHSGAVGWFAYHGNRIGTLCGALTCNEQRCSSSTLSEIMQQPYSIIFETWILSPPPIHDIVLHVQGLYVNSCRHEVLKREELPCGGRRSAAIELNAMHVQLYEF